MEEEKVYKVYIHICLINLKVYVGITKQKPEQRWRNGKGYKQNPHFWNAIQKYGWDNFKHIVLFDRLTKQDAEEIEIELIAFHKSNQYKYGYNRDNGGNCIGTHSEKTRIKIKKKLTGKKQPLEVVQKRIKSCIGKKRSLEFKIKCHNNKIGKLNPMYGRAFSEEHKRKIRENHAHLSGENNPMSKKVLCIESNEIFMSCTSAGKRIGVTRCLISMVCRGIRNSAKGLHFKFYIDKDE